jgi:pimeloyl-ACP methyl ester carboxylesterase
MPTPSHLEVTSEDGTVLGADVIGTGPTLLLVHGGTADRTRWAPLVPLLEDEFSCVLMDRRGRATSTREAADYAIEREGEDVLAMLTALPRPAMVFGHSYGASVTTTVLDRLPADAVVLYEPPFDTAGHEMIPAALLERWAGLLADGRREEVLESFYRDVLRFDDPAIDALRPLPMWQARVAAVHTVVREGDAVRALRPAPVRPAMPVRILLGEVTTPALAASTRAAAELIEGSELTVLPGQGHVAIDSATELVAQHVRETWARAAS